VRDDKRLPPHVYRIMIFGARYGEGEILPDRILAINPGSVREPLDGIATKDPTYGLDAVWIVEEQRRAARAAGYTVVDPVTVLATHLTEVIRKQSANLLTRAETERLVNRVRTENAGLVEEVVPGVMSLGEIQKVLQNLLRERVSIRNLELILEVLADAGKLTKDSAVLTELVREKLGPTICQGLLNPDGALDVIVLDPAVEQALAAGIRGDGGKQRLIVDPALAQQILARIAGQVEKMIVADLMPALLCAPELRRHLWMLTERVLPQLSVLSMAEVPPGIPVKSYGLVQL
jgi:flagellar biosynthesis protein FlhA